MLKKFLIIALLAAITINVNIFARNISLAGLGNGKDAAVGVCPIKGMSHHGHEEDNGHGEHHNNHRSDTSPELKHFRTGFIKCNCSYEYNTSAAAYEITMQDSPNIIPFRVFEYNLTEEKIIYQSINSIPLEGPPKIIFPDLNLQGQA